jgi:hypothetical protein
MKKILLITAVVRLFAGVAGVAKADIVCCDCTATGFWETCTFYYNTYTHEFWGAWEGNGLEGSLEGEATSVSITGDVTGSGTFGGDYSGDWDGVFLWSSDTCYGTYCSYTVPPIPPNGTIGGNLCD